MERIRNGVLFLALLGLAACEGSAPVAPTSEPERETAPELPAAASVAPPISRTDARAELVIEPGWAHADVRTELATCVGLAAYGFVTPGGSVQQLVSKPDIRLVEGRKVLSVQLPACGPWVQVDVVERCMPFPRDYQFPDDLGPLLAWRVVELEECPRLEPEPTTTIPVPPPSTTTTAPPCDSSQPPWCCVPNPPAGCKK